MGGRSLRVPLKVGHTTRVRGRIECHGSLNTIEGDLLFPVMRPQHDGKHM